MKTVREKFLTVAEAEKATGVHYTVKHSGKWKECRVYQLAAYVINIVRIDQPIPIWYVHIVMHKDK